MYRYSLIKYKLTYRLEGHIEDREYVVGLQGLHDVWIGVAPPVLQAHPLQVVLGGGGEAEDVEVRGSAAVFVHHEAVLLLVDALLVGLVVLLVQLIQNK